MNVLSRLRHQLVTHFITTPRTWWLLLILVFAFVTRAWRVSYPSTYYFDEVYHASTAKLVSRHDPRAYEWWNPAPEPDTAVDWLHPPLAKLTQGFAMALLGENSLGWRMSSVIFGTAAVGMVYLLTKKLGFAEDTALLAAGLFSLDGLALTASRIAMNDIHVTFFILLTWWCYWHWRQRPTVYRAIAVGLAAGAAVSSKWSGVFAPAGIIMDQLFEYFGRGVLNQPWRWRDRLILGLALAWMVAGMYLLSYQQMFLQGKDMAHFQELHNQIWWYQTHLEAEHPYESRPFQWMLNQRPVYAFTASDSTIMRNIYLQGNSILFWSGAVAMIWSLSDIFLVLRAMMNTFTAGVQRHNTHSAWWTDQWQRVLTLIANHRRTLFLLIAYSIVWLPWIFSPRIMFFYHYLPAVPILSMLVAIQLQTWARLNPTGQLIRTLVIGLIGLNFLLFFPNWTALPVSETTFAPIYFFFKSWR